MSIRVFISSTYNDLIEHRTAVNEVLSRMKINFSAMEYFGSRTDEATPVCQNEISQCNFLIGIYAWRYGWQSSPDSPSITEQEFDYARILRKKCLIYLIDENYPWPPIFIDNENSRFRLELFKSKVSKLVRSTFTTPDNLAKQVVADLAREIAPQVESTSFGGILRINWEVFSPEVQNVLLVAHAQALNDPNRDGVVATRHVISALANIPNTAKALISAFKDVSIENLYPGLIKSEITDVFSYDKPISSCVLASMNRLLPYHSRTERLLAIELAVDLIKNGRGSSVAAFRIAGIDGTAVEKTYIYMKKIASDFSIVSQALSSLDDSEIYHIAYVVGLNIINPDPHKNVREVLYDEALKTNSTLVLIGEIMRRYPRFVEI